MYTELKPMMVSRFVEVYVAESSYGVTQRVQFFKGIVSKTEKFGYAIFMPITMPQPSAPNKMCKGVNYIIIDESTIMEIVDLSQATSRMVLNKAPVIQKVADLEFLFGIDPLKKLEEMETQTNHFIFKDFYLDIEFCREGAKMPTRANHDDAGMDVYSPAEYSIPPRGDVIIPSGLKTSFPKGFALIFKEKSGRATKNKLDIGACVLFDTLVQTNMGLMPVSLLTPDYLKKMDLLQIRGWDNENKQTYWCNFDGFRPSNVTECVRLTFDDGSTLDCSHDHKILTTNGWKNASDLTETDEIIKG